MSTTDNNLTRVDALIQHTNKNGFDWKYIDLPVPKDLLVYIEDQNVIKRGDGINKIDTLPVLIDLNKLEEIYVKSSIITPYLNSEENFQKIIVISSDGHVKTTSFLTYQRLKNIIDYVNNNLDKIRTGTDVILKPIINGPKVKKYGTVLELQADSYSAYEYDEIEYFWILPDNTTVEGPNYIVYTIPIDTSLLEKEIEFKCKAKSSFFGCASSFSFFRVKVSNYDNPVVLGSTFSLLS